jgi:hypothetical protein
MLAKLQRIWTLQEWCCSRQLVAYTEHTDLCSDKFAFLPEEHTFLEKLRAQQAAKYKDCRPYWLLSQEERSMDPGFALQIAKQYDDLSKHMTCKIETDKIRALIPMVCATGPSDASHTTLYYNACLQILGFMEYVCR